MIFQILERLVAALRPCEVKQLAACLQATGNSAELGQTPRHGPFSTTAHAGKFEYKTAVCQ